MVRKFLYWNQKTRTIEAEEAKKNIFSRFIFLFWFLFIFLFIFLTCGEPSAALFCGPKNFNEHK